MHRQSGILLYVLQKAIAVLLGAAGDVSSYPEALEVVSPRLVGRSRMDGAVWLLVRSLR